MLKVFDAIALEALYQISCKSRRAVGQKPSSKNDWFLSIYPFGYVNVWIFLLHSKRPKDAFIIESVN